MDLVALRKSKRILEIRRLELRTHAGTFQLTWLQRKENELTASSGSAGSSPTPGPLLLSLEGPALRWGDMRWSVHCSAYLRGLSRRESRVRLGTETACVRISWGAGYGGSATSNPPAWWGQGSGLSLPKSFFFF